MPVAHDSLIARAVLRLRAGGLVYGLGADASNAQAVASIFAAKGRPVDHPLIVHIATASDMAHWAAQIPATAITLAERYWPGPLTLILRRAAHVSDGITGGQNTVGLRCPSHPVAHRLLAACREVGMLGLAAPSANRFGHVSPTTAAHVRSEFDGSLMVLDGGPCAVGIESTIVDVSNGGARVLRPGMISAADIAECVGADLVDADRLSPRVPGALAQHYAPATRLHLLESAALIARARELGAGRRIGVLATPDTLSRINCAAALPAPSVADDYARLLYASLRDLDLRDLDCILVEMPPATADWEAIRDRLMRAAAGSAS
jgi:L-threonylcarbamoyladenylate synthase